MKNTLKNNCRILTILFFLLFIAGITKTFAQSTSVEIGKKSFDELIYIEADPFAYLNKGYSIHLGYENFGWRLDLTKVKVDFPESFENAFYSTKAFDLISHISGIKIDYIGNRQNWTRGAFVGLDVNTQRLNLTHRESNVIDNLKTFNVGVRAGHKIEIYKGLYITPWAAVWRNVKDVESFEVAGDRISTNEWDWILTLHVGYAVKL